MFVNLIGINTIMRIIKIFVRGCGLSYLMNKSSEEKPKIIEQIYYLFCNIIISTICILIENKINYFISFIGFILLWSICISFRQKFKLGYSIIEVIFLSSIIYMILIISGMLSSGIYSLMYGTVRYTVLQEDNNYSLECFIADIVRIGFFFIVLLRIMKIKRLRKGFDFIKKKINDDSFDILVLNISIIIMSFSAIFATIKSTINITVEIGISLLLYAVLYIIIIFKSIKAYYKENLKNKEFEKIKNELEEIKKENKRLEYDNLEISKKIHSIKHNQNVLEFMIKEMNEKFEKEEKEKLTNMLNEISNEIYVEINYNKIQNTGINDIDDVLNYFKSYCDKENIKFDVQIRGNIYFMINNLISKNELKTLLSDHIKDAIIAIKHSENVNRSILVKLGMIDGIYGVSIYDSGVEFPEKVLEKLGKTAITTYKDEGGTGLGFLNTFDTLKKCNASLIIKRLGNQSIENFTKIVIIKFDEKNEFLVK